jgi:RNA polymerase sigma factor (sigma-70 family)
MSDDEPPEDAGGLLRTLLARIRDGDEEAARELLKRYEAQVRLVVRRQLPKLLRSRFDSLDFLQSVWGSFFRRVQGGVEDLEDPRNLVAFLARAARNKVIDEYRRAASLKHDIRREEPLWSDDGRPRDLEAKLETASELVEAEEALGRLRQLLPDDRHEVLELKARGLSSREIGDRLGLSERTVRRVIEDLRHRAESDGEG